MRNLILCFALIVGLGGTAVVTLPGLNHQVRGAESGEMGPHIDPGGRSLGPDGASA